MGEITNKNAYSKGYIFIITCSFTLLIIQIIFSLIERNSYSYLRGSVPLEYSFENYYIGLLQIMWAFRGLFFYCLVITFYFFYKKWHAGASFNMILITIMGYEIIALIGHLITHYYNISFILTIFQITCFPFVFIKGLKIQNLRIKLAPEKTSKEFVDKPSARFVAIVVSGLILYLSLLIYLSLILP